MSSIGGSYWLVLKRFHDFSRPQKKRWTCKFKKVILKNHWIQAGELGGQFCSYSLSTITTSSIHDRSIVSPLFHSPKPVITSLFWPISSVEFRELRSISIWRPLSFRSKVNISPGRFRWPLLKRANSWVPWFPLDPYWVSGLRYGYPGTKIPHKNHPTLKLIKRGHGNGW